MRPARMMFGAAVLLAARVFADDPQGGSTGEDYELRVGERTISVALDQEFTIETPKGEKLKATLRAKPVRNYRGADLAFAYPREFSLEQETDGGSTIVTVEAADSRLIIVQSHPAAAEPGVLVQATLDALRAQLKDGAQTGAPARQSEVRRKFSGREVAGTRLEYTIMKQKIRTDVFGFKAGGRSLLIMLQTDHEDAAAAEKSFAVFAESLEPRK